jgi:hypothetical protein
MLLSVFGCGMMVNTGRAAWQTFTGGPRVFERTPKFGVRNRRDDWRGLRYQLALDPIVYVELTLAAVNVATCIIASSRGYWAIAVYSAIFAAGLLGAAGTTLRQTARTGRARRREASGALEVG